MAMGATLIILTLWMAFIWFVDPDGISRGPTPAVREFHHE